MLSYILIILSFAVIINIFLAEVIVSRNWNSLTNLLFGSIAVACSAWGISIIGFFFYPTLIISISWAVCAHAFGITIAYLFLQFAARFPRQIYSKTILIISGLLFLFELYELFIVKDVIGSSNTTSYTLGNHFLGYVFILIGFFSLGYVLLIFQIFLTHDTAQRKQLFIMLVAGAISSACVLFSSILLPYFGIFYFTWLGPIFTLVLVSGIFIAILRYHLFSIKIIIAKLMASLMLAFILFFTFIETTSNTQQLYILVCTTVLTITVSFLMIRSVNKEVSQRELIERQKADLETINYQQENLVHFISHEIKGYLTTSVAGFAAIAQGDFGPVSPDIANMANAALTNVRKGVCTVMDILKASNLKRAAISSKNTSEFDFQDRVQAEGRHDGGMPS